MPLRSEILGLLYLSLQQVFGNSRLYDKALRLYYLPLISVELIDSKDRAEGEGWQIVAVSEGFYRVPNTSRKSLIRTTGLLRKIVHFDAHVSQVFQHVMNVVVENKPQGERTRICDGAGARPG